jgi:bifunctional non-homologous end joining protein LigD
MPDTPRTTLYFKQGGSDKIYHASVEPSGDGYVVNFAFGRRGSTLTNGTKTAAPVPLAAAVAIYEKLVKEKTSKGYTPGEDGKPYQMTDKADRATGIVPQLLQPIDESAVEPLLTDDQWLLQEKFDGRRVLVIKAGAEVTGVNRTGLSIALQMEIVTVLQAATAQSFLFDGESVGDRYHVFDLLELNGDDLRPKPYAQRLEELAGVLKGLPDPTVRVTETIAGEPAKRKKLAQLREQGREGAVFKRADAPSTPGRPASGGTQVKLKFHATASCLVAAGRVNKRSVALELIDSDKKVPVGNVTISANFDIPKPGTVVEVRYLYAYPGGSLYQPVYLGPRDDIAAKDCTVKQLKFKAEAEDA